jgi:flagellar biosynthetic protein FliR
VISGLTDSVLATFIVFCRIGACLMLVPGFSSVNIPAQIRLFVAIVTTFALTPLLIAKLQPLLADAPPLTLAFLISSELLIGSVIGLGGRMFFLALQTMLTAMASAIGLSNIPGTQVGDVDPAPALVPLIMAAVTTLFFMTDQHWQVLRGLMNSYDVWHPGDRISGDMALAQPVHRLLRRRQSGDRPHQQADAGDTRLFHFGPVRNAWWISAALPNQRRAADAIHDRHVIEAGGMTTINSRAEKLDRMVSLVKLQLRLSEWQLAQLRQQEKQLHDEEAYLVGALNGMELPMGSSSESISRRLTTTSVGVHAVQAQASRQRDQVRAENRRARQLEQVVKAAMADKLRDAERRSLEEMTGVNPDARHWTSIANKSDPGK